MGKDKNQNKSNKKTNYRVNHCYWYVHFIELVFILVILYAFLCELEIFDAKFFSITDSDAYASIKNFFSVETEEGTRVSLDFLNQIIVILLPLLVTVLTISFSLLSEDISNIKYSQFRLFGLNREYRFISMIFISVILFVADIVFYYLGFILCSLIINAVSLFYIIFFCWLEIPLLSREDKRTYHMLKKAMEKVYQGKPKFANKRYVDEAAACLVNQDGLDYTYNMLNHKNKPSSDKLDKSLEYLLMAYSNNLLNSISDRTISEKDINKFLKVCKDYFDLWGRAINDFNESKDFVTVDANILWNFFKNIDFNSPFGWNALQQLFQTLVPASPVDFSSLKEKGFPELWDYKTGKLLQIGITNTLLISSLYSLDFAFANEFLKMYIADKENKHDINLFAFTTIHLYFLNQTKGISDTYAEFYSSYSKNLEYNNLVKKYLHLNSENKSIDVFDCILVLKRLLDIYQTVVEGPCYGVVTWFNIPNGFTGSFLPFYKNEIYNWWLTFLFAMDIQDLAEFKAYLYKLIDEKEINGMLAAYSTYWKEDTDFKENNKYESYFTSQGVEFDFNSEKSIDIKTKLDELCHEAIENKIIKRDAYNQSKQNIKIRENAKQKALNDCKHFVDYYMKKNVKKFEFYSPRQNKKTQNFVLGKSHNFVFSSLNSDKEKEHDALQNLLNKYFAEDGPNNLFGRAFQECFAMKYLYKSGEINCKHIDAYTNAMVDNILKSNPTKKYAPNIEQRPGFSECKNKDRILSIKDVSNSISFDGDTYIMGDDSIKFNIIYKGVSNIHFMDETELSNYINRYISPYEENGIKKYKYYFNGIIVFVTQDELIKLWSDRAITFDINFEHHISCDTNKIIMFYFDKHGE